jgi:hypothetical protein
VRILIDLLFFLCVLSPGACEDDFWLRAYVPEPVSVESWRPLVEKHFAADQVDTAMRVMNCETGATGDPNSYNSGSHASGLFQQLPKYWDQRAIDAGWEGADIMDPEANVAVSAWLQRYGGGWSHWSCY